MALVLSPFFEIPSIGCGAYAVSSLEAQADTVAANVSCCWALATCMTMRSCLTCSASLVRHRAPRSRVASISSVLWLRSNALRVRRTPVRCDPLAAQRRRSGFISAKPMRPFLTVQSPSWSRTVRLARMFSQRWSGLPAMRIFDGMSSHCAARVWTTTRPSHAVCCFVVSRCPRT
jgi:hypothetical protein